MKPAILIAANRIKTEDWAFQVNEIQALFLAMGKEISQEIAQMLYEKTGGWLMGLLFYADNPNATTLPIGLYDYFKDFFEEQTEVIRKFLLKTASFEVVDEEGCHSAFGDGDWADLINDLLKRNLFVSGVHNENGTQLTYQPLFKSFLQLHYENLLVLAKRWVKEGEWDEAYEMYTFLDDMTGVADLIEVVGLKLWLAGEHQKLLGWIKVLPMTVLEDRGKILALKGQTEISLGNLTQGLELLNLAIVKLDEENDIENHSRALVWRAVAHRLSGDSDASLKDANEALALVKDKENLKSILAGSKRAKGLALHYSARASESLGWFKKSFELYKKLGYEHDAAIVAQDVGIVYADLKYNFSEAKHYYTIADSYWSKINNEYRMSNTRNNLGDLHLSNQYCFEAFEYFEKAVVLARNSGHIRMEAFALAGLADVYMTTMEHATARVAYNAAYDTALKASDNFLMIYIKVAKLMMACHQEVSREIEIASNELKQMKPNSPHEHGLCKMAFGYETLSKKEDAITLLTEAVNLLEPTGQVADIDSAKTLLAWANNAQEKPYNIDGIQMSQKVITLGHQNQKHLKAHGMKWPKLKAEVKLFDSELPLARQQIRHNETIFKHSRQRVRLQVFDTAQVLVNGKPITAPLSTEAKQLLFVFILQHDLKLLEIGDLFWIDLDEGQMKWRVRDLIRELKSAIGSDAIVLKNKRYSLNPEIEFECDFAICNNLIDEAKANSDQRIELFEQAASICSSLDRKIMAHWTQAKQDAFETSIVEMLMELATFYSKTEDYHKTLKYSLKAWHIQPYLGSVTQFAMKMHKLEPAKIVRLFEQHKSLLEDMGLAISPETVQLYEELIKEFVIRKDADK